MGLTSTNALKACVGTCARVITLKAQGRVADSMVILTVIGTSEGASNVVLVRMTLTGVMNSVVTTMFSVVAAMLPLVLVPRLNRTHSV